MAVNQSTKLWPKKTNNYLSSILFYYYYSECSKTSQSHDPMSVIFTTVNSL